MATDTDRVQGEVAEDTSGTEMDVERLLIGFLRSLIDEQNEGKRS